MCYILEYGLVGGTWSQTNSNEAMETGLFHRCVAVHSFLFGRSTSCNGVYRCRVERFADACVPERDRFGGGSVMVWGGISHGLKSPLIVIAGNLTGVRYRDEILRTVAVPFVQQQHLIFQQDYARPHVARVCQDFPANHNIDPLDWPPYSSDLSPIEPLWDEMNRT